MGEGEAKVVLDGLADFCGGMRGDDHPSPVAQTVLMPCGIWRFRTDEEELEWEDPTLLRERPPAAVRAPGSGLR
ncbi:MAG: hypothetical protein H5T97_08085 [Firmicutes bacterium]|nr:hypothetical protein [Bacillota bacterium]